MIARVRVLASTRVTPTVHSVRFERPPGFVFAPVQFCGLELSTQEGPVEYPMSLACSPTKPYLEFGARASDSPWKQAFAALRPGDEAEVDGAYGHFVLDEAAPAVLVAGGIGITPLKGMAEFAADRELPIDTRLVYSSRDEEEMAYRSELEALTQQNPRFSVFHTLTRAPWEARWKGRRGRISADLLAEASRGLSHPTYYVCGAPGMVQEAYRLLLQLGVGSDRVLYEVFRGYGGRVSAKLGGTAARRS
ncbi:MAG: FAD-dependent oxidoreductase [Thermoplasmata archaeon]|nr:FAD-dependent oxidoreductase [Thermoplasmata archaeon]